MWVEHDQSKALAASNPGSLEHLESQAREAEIQEISPYRVMKRASQLRAIKVTANGSPKADRTPQNELRRMIGEHGAEARSQRVPRIRTAGIQLIGSKI